MANLASAGSRIVAAIVDIVILAIITTIVTFPFGAIAISAIDMTNPANINFQTIGSMFGISSLLSTLIFLAYFTYFEGNSGQTPGKRILGIKVAKENGKKMGMADAFIRTILRIIDFLPFIYIIGFIAVIATDKKQRIGDMAAGTIVVRA